MGKFLGNSTELNILFINLIFVRIASDKVNLMSLAIDIKIVFPHVTSDEKTLSCGEKKYSKWLPPKFTALN